MSEGDVGRGGRGNSCYLFGLRRCSQCGRNWVDNILWRRMLGNGQGSCCETFFQAFIPKCLLGLHGQITKGLRIPFFK